MGLIECENGHLYDSEQYVSCPYCSGNMNRIEFSGVGKTVGAAPRQDMPAGSEVGSTVAPSGYQKQDNDPSEVGKTVSVMQANMKLEPVVGWLVCIEGKEKGKDYRIYARVNTIGRSDRMDICVRGDQAISRENHARLAYDAKFNVFHLIPAEGSNTIYLNNEPIYVPMKLKAMDLIELGESRFCFIPLCSDAFNWTDGLKKDEAE